MISKVDYVELGLTCADVCKALDRGTNRRRVNQLSQSVLTAIEKLTVQVEQAMPMSDDLLTNLSSQYCGRDPEEHRQMG